MKKLLIISIPTVVPTEYLTQQEIANLLAIDVRTARKWTRKGILKCYKFGHRIFYKRHDLIQTLMFNFH